MLEEVAIFNSLEEANVAVGFLRANDIDASLADAHMTGLSPLGAVVRPRGHTVVAPRGQADDARHLLREVAEGSHSIEGDGE